MQKSREDKKSVGSRALKLKHKNNYNYQSALPIAAADYCDRSRKEKNKNEISFKTIHKDNKERKKILLNFAILFKKKHEKEEKSRKENKQPDP